MDVVQVPVTLETAGETVAAIDVTLTLPDGGAEVLRNGRGDPACTVNRAIDKGSSVFRFVPAGCAPERGIPCQALRALILSFYDVNPIPDGSLFSCRLRVTAVDTGVVPFPCAAAAAASPDKRLLPVDCRGGGVIVQSVATPTPTFTPTRTWTPPPFGSPTPTPNVRLRIGTAAGKPGDLVQVPVRLSADAPVVGALVEIELPNGGAEFAVTGVGLPDCAVNPGLGKDDSAFGFLPPGCTPGLDCSAVRAIVLSFRNAEPISGDEEVFTCRLRISANAGGVVPLVCGIAQTSPPQPPNGVRDNYFTSCGGGGIVVTGSATSTPTASRTATAPPTYTATASPTVTSSPTPSRTASATATLLSTPTATATATYSPTATASLTATESPSPSATATPTATPVATDTPSPSATATPTASATATPIRCVGDCNGDQGVTVDELVRGVAIALGNLPAAQCPALDRNGDLEVAVHELINAVNNALGGCPSSA